MAKSKSTPMTKIAASRIQSSTAKRGGGGVPAKGFAARAQRAASRSSKMSK